MSLRRGTEIRDQLLQRGNTVHEARVDRLLTNEQPSVGHTLEYVVCGRAAMRGDDIVAGQALDVLLQRAAARSRLE